MEFKEWLRLDEGPRWGAAGAFGNTRKGYRQDNQYQNRDDRVAYGKGIEKQIFDSLKGCGLVLKPATTKEDITGKIDGWWIKDGQQFPIQIKYRDTGDDILFEVLKDYRAGLPGRDMVGQATYYAVMDRTGKNINVVSVAEAKSLIKIAYQEATAKGFDKNGNFSMNINGHPLYLKIRPDPATQIVKMMAYIPVNSLKPVIPPCLASARF